MEFTALYRRLIKQKYYVFSYEDILSFFPDERRSNLKTMLMRWKKKKWISPLRRGLYELTYPQGLTLPDLFIANRLYHPSYVSLETALSYYSLIPEVAMAVTSVTAKTTRRFKNEHGLFIYRSIQPRAFSGYRVERQNGFEILIAEPEKALADYLYFNKKSSGKGPLSDERMDAGAVKRSLKKAKLRKYLALYGLLPEALDAYA